MDNIIHAAILALIQGLTEFLPVSSSAHLILVPILLGWPDQGLAFDVIIHLGTLCAVIFYFRKELWIMLTDLISAFKHKADTKHLRLALAIVIGTIPVGIAGIVFNSFIATYLRAPSVIACTTIVFGVLLGIASMVAKRKRNEYTITWKDALFIGIAQALSLIPGTSRSGITLTAGLFAGFTNNAAARYSFLLSIPVIILAGLFQIYKLASSSQVINYQVLAVGFIVAAISGYLCIKVFLQLLDRYGVMPFVIYRLLLGIILLAIFV